MPHGGVEGFSLSPGTENALVFTNHFVPAVAGNAGEGVIDFDDRSAGVGDRNSFPSMGENACGKLQFYLTSLQVCPFLRERRLGILQAVHYVVNRCCKRGKLPSATKRNPVTIITSRNDLRTRS